MLPEWLGGSIAFLYGAVVGSFLNVCIYRIPAEKSVVNPPSHCPRCEHKLGVFDNIPLLSFLMLGRKCRYCREPISWRYFVIELVTALVFLAIYLRYHYGIEFFAYALFASAGIVAFMIDVDHMIIPDQVVFVGIAVGIARDIAHIIAGDAKLMEMPVGPDSVLPMLPSVAGMVVCAGVFYMIAYGGYFLFKPKDKDQEDEYEGAMGGGDVNLAAAIGAVLGVFPALVSFLIAVLVGTVCGVTLLILRARAERRGVPWRTEIPFGPYMVIGAMAIILMQPQLDALWKSWVNLIVPS